MKTILAAALALTTLAGCAHGSREPGVVDCVIADSFSPDQQVAAYEAFHAWETASAGTFQCRYAFMKGGTFVEERANLISVEPGATWEAWRLGVTEYTGRPNHEVNSKIVIRADESIDSFRMSLTHELGHALGLNHVVGGEASIMRASAHDASPTITDRDVNAYFTWWSE